jgi:hypothetical protein
VFYYAIFLHRWNVLQYYSSSFPLPSPFKQSHYYRNYIYDHVCICILDLSSTYGRKYSAFVILNLAYFTWYDDLQFYPFTWNWQNFIFYDWIILYCIYTPHFLNSLSAVGCLDYFHSLAINMSVRVSILYPDLPNTWYFHLPSILWVMASDFSLEIFQLDPLSHYQECELSIPLSPVTAMGTLLKKDHYNSLY